MPRHDQAVPGELPAPAPDEEELGGALMSELRANRPLHLPCYLTPSIARFETRMGQ
jgi:hypothetical protein